MPSETPIEENDDMLISQDSPFLALYRRDTDLTCVAKMEFGKKGPSRTISCAIDTRTHLGTLAFLDIKLISPAWESRSLLVTLAKTMMNKLAAVESIFIDNGHGAPIEHGMQVRVYRQQGDCH
jgi:hypothetical protein